MKTIRMKKGKSCAGPQGQFLEGKEYAVDDLFADLLVKAGACYIVKAEVVAESKPVLPVASLEPEHVAEPKSEPKPSRRGKLKPKVSK